MKCAVIFSARNIAFITIVVLAFFLNDCGHHNTEKLKNEICTVWLDEAYHKGNIEILNEIFTPDIIYHRPLSPDIMGLEAYKQHVKNVRAAFPDIRITMGNFVAEEDTIVCIGIIQYTKKQISPASGISTSRTINYSYCTVLHMNNGKIAEAWDHYDDSRFMQLGYKMLPPLTPNTFAQVTITPKNPEKMAESAKIYGESVVPEIKKQKGFRGCLLLDDFKTGKSISIVLWEREEDVRAVEQSGFYKTQIDKFRGMFTAQPIREGYTVTVQK
jgi:predicted ester cyclase/heme-degrading monooxygenase HmoA